MLCKLLSVLHAVPVPAEWDRTDYKVALEKRQ